MTKPVDADDHPYIVALTGGIASGKTLVSDKFSELGVPVIDTDIIAHQIVEPDQAALKEIESTFGSEIIDEHGFLRRKKLRALIFSDVDARNKLELILHPIIRQKVAEAIANLRSEYCIVVIPLLAEHDAFPNVDRVLVVDVEAETQITRLVARDCISRGQALRALASQAERKQRIGIADDVLDNSGSTEKISLAVEHLHSKYLTMARSKKQRANTK